MVLKWTARSISPITGRATESRGSFLRDSFAMPGRSTGQEKKTMDGQIYSICGRCTLATWFSLSPVLGKSYIAMSGARLTQYDTSIPNHEPSKSHQHTQIRK